MFHHVVSALLRASESGCARALGLVCTDNATPLTPKNLLPSATRFMATLPCERVHMLCPVPALRPDNYRYIYHSK